MKRLKVAVVVLQDSLLSAVLGIEDIFTICNSNCKKEEEAFFKITFVSIDEDLEFSKVKLELQRIKEDDDFDIVMIPPGASGRPSDLDAELKRWLIQMYHHETTLSAACVGSFILAQTGLLDYKRATTHWLFEHPFTQHFPRVDLQSEKILVDEGNLITAGGVTAYFDLCLYLIEKYLSNETANLCASLLLVERGRDSQQCYKDLSSILLVEDEEIKKLLVWMKKNIDKVFTIKSLAKRVSLQERSFMRRFKKAVHTTPNHYLQNLRIEKAKTILINSEMSFEDITYEVGFSNESSFRRLFKRETSLNPGEYRKKFKHSL